MDIVEPKTLEENHQPYTPSDGNQSSTVQVSNTQMTLIYQVHQMLFKHLVETDWYKPEVLDRLKLSDWIRPFLSTYSSASLLACKLVDVLGRYSTV